MPGDCFTDSEAHTHCAWSGPIFSDIRSVYLNHRQSALIAILQPAAFRVASLNSDTVQFQ